MPTKEKSKAGSAAALLWRGGIAKAVALSLSMAGGVVAAQPSETSSASPAPRSEEDRRQEIDEREDEEWMNAVPYVIQNEVRAIREFFEITLPDTLKQYDLSLDYTPKFGDLLRRDYLRFPLTLSYGLTDRTELRLGTTPFTPNPFRSGEDSRWGLGRIRMGARHKLEDPLPFFDQSTIGFDVEVPLGRPPSGIADYYGRLRPSISSARRLKSIRHTYFLLGLAHDRAFEVPLRRAHGSFPMITRTSVSPGFIYKPDNVGYVVDYSLRFIERDTGDRWAHVYTVGVLWELPRRRAPRYLPGDWRFDLAYRLKDEQTRQLDHSINLRVNVRFDFRGFLREVR